MATRALEDVRVLDLTHYVAGPYCTKLLADYGAEVLKIEKLGEGDGARRVGPFAKDDPHLEKSGLFLFLNANKKSITLNLKTAAGTQIFHRLVEQADILVENFSPKVMPSLGLSYSALGKINPKLVMTSISNFGQRGPYKDYKAKDIVSFALGGVLYTSGEPDMEPVRYPGPQSQFHAGLVAAVATMSALFHARRTGKGQHIDVSIMEAVLNVLELGIMRYPYSGYIEERSGSFFGFYPWGVYACRDGYVSVCANNRQWRRVGKWIGMPELSENPAYRTPADRLQRLEELDAIFVPWCLERTKAEIVSSAQAAGIPAIEVYTPKDMLEDAHYKAREFFVEVNHPVVGRLTYPGAPFKMSETPWQIRSAAPLLGEHNEEVYCAQLGYSRESYIILRENGVI